MLPHGGATVALLQEADTVAVGISACAPVDSFSRKRGRLIAEGRARKAAQEKVQVKAPVCRNGIVETVVRLLGLG